MKNKKSLPKEFEGYDDYKQTASTQECTGLIPTAAINKAEVESYEELFPFLPKIPTQDTEVDG